MAKHDLVEKDNDGDGFTCFSNHAKTGGCESNLCGLWRQHVTKWEGRTGQAEDAVTYDRIWFPEKMFHLQ